MIYERELKLTLEITANDAEYEEVVDGAVDLFEQRVKNIRFSTPSCAVRVIEIDRSKSRKEQDRTAVRMFIERFK